jgi:archaellum component FlaC
LKKAKGGFPVPNQEERLKTLFANLKQVQTETVKSYGEMAVELTMVKGLAEDAVKRLASLKDQIDHRFERVDIRFERVDSRLDGMDTHLESMDGRLGRLENILAQVLARLPEKP